MTNIKGNDTLKNFALLFWYFWRVEFGEIQ